jgi:hypothetical protein
MNYKIISVVSGLLVWLVVSIAIRMFGQLVFIPGDPAVLAVLYLASFAGLVLALRLMFRLMSLLVQQVFLATILMVLPGMVLDGVALAFYPVVFPNLDPAACGLFGGWLLVAYAGVLAGAVTWPIGRRH